MVTAARYRAQRLRYDAVADPYTVIHVETNDIEQFNEEIGTNWGLGRIESGHWDAAQNCRPIRSSTHYQGLKQRFEEGYDWKDTVYYQQRKHSIANDDENRLEYVEKLYEDIRTNGYRPNYEAVHDAPDFDGRQSRFRHLHSLEPLVLIARDGETYLAEGFHRLAIAKLVGVAEVPVNVLARHEEWQHVREAVRRHGGNATAAGLGRYADHPDLRDVTNEVERSR
ncbi:ParB N-terminal domain-containing protein [Halorubrum sp. DTA46]|uniref:ParB N-terminal domain-containing protein n=1 Tax=Halorubrum sp. DTA46 TaxID=3402162 RepID=UPI003AAB8246